MNQFLTAGANGASSPAALLAEHPDPTVRLVAQLWSQNQAASAEQDAGAEGAISSAADLDALRTAAECREARWRRRVTRLQAELDQLRALCDTLALALGACHVCWGQDEDCPACFGRGQVGAFVPDRELFDQYVLPAMRRARSGTTRSAAQTDPPATTSHSRREA
jgi:hypothetical protein